MFPHKNLSTRCKGAKGRKDEGAKGRKGNSATGSKQQATGRQATKLFESGFTGLEDEQD
ncbi:MAG: hypothetical protein LBL58_05225 [Tannerellaceae bacterium]|jgi:hypothetical protein|nr:hypothetical protein [Tannerellaceae bacterium]